jgi:hypothetical protein
MTMLRSLLAQRGYVALSVLTLALSVGANVVVFTIVNALWLRPRPVAAPERVVVISSLNQGGVQFDALGRSELDELRRSGLFSGVAGQATALGIMGYSKPRLEIGDAPGAVETLAVTADYFEVLGIGVRGRAFTDADDDRAAPTTVIISDRLWRDRFDGGDVIGQTVPTSYEPTTIIGIAPPGFHGARLGELADAWIPAATAVRFTPLVRLPEAMEAFRPSFQSFLGLGRLAPGESVESAARQLDAANPDLLVFPLPGIMAAPGLLTTEIREGRLLGVVGATAALVLIAGCATLAALVMVHYERRRREFAVRLALGSGRARLAQRLVAELGVIAVLGMAAAFGLASTTLDAVRTLSLPAGLTLERLDLVIDWRVVLGAVSGTVLTLAVAGL